MADRFLYNELIAIAIWDSPNQMLTIGGIVKYLREMFTFFRSWKSKKMCITITNVLLTDDIFVAINITPPPNPWILLWTIREEVASKFHGGGPLQWRKVIIEWKKSKKGKNWKIWEHQIHEKRCKLINQKIYQ